MADLTDTQLMMLSRAAQRDDRIVELPTNLKGSAAQKVNNRRPRRPLPSRNGWIVSN